MKCDPGLHSFNAFALCWFGDEENTGREKTETGSIEKYHGDGKEQ